MAWADYSHDVTAFSTAEHRQAMNRASASADAAFGPQLTGQYDFTLLFEHSVLSIGPSLVILLVSPVQELAHLPYQQPAMDQARGPFHPPCSTIRTRC